MQCCPGPHCPRQRPRNAAQRAWQLTESRGEVLGADVVARRHHLTAGFCSEVGKLGPDEKSLLAGKQQRRWTAWAGDEIGQTWAGLIRDWLRAQILGQKNCIALRLFPFFCHPPPPFHWGNGRTGITIHRCEEVQRPEKGSRQAPAQGTAWS